MCSKKTFSKIEAATALNKNKQNSNHRNFRREKRMYYCNDCNGWHLTSEDKREETETYNVEFQDKWNNLLNDSNN